MIPWKGRLGVFAVLVAGVAVGAFTLWPTGFPPANGDFTVSIALGLHPLTTPERAAALARHYLDEQTPELAAPNLHQDPRISGVAATLAREAVTVEPRIPQAVAAAQPDRIVWIVAASGDFLNLHDLAWSRSGAPYPEGTIVIDDSSGTILGVYPHLPVEAASSAEPPGAAPAALASPAGASSATPVPSAFEDAWPGRVVATFVSEADTLAYDARRRVVWLPVTQTVGPDYLYRYDPASGTTTRWRLPETTYRGVMAQVVVDDGGAVWVNDDGYRLVRFDPDTGSMASYVFPLEVPGADWANGGTWISAIAADGDGVLVARSQVPHLVHLGPTLAITNTITLPAGFAGATGLAVAGAHLFMTAGGPGRDVARLSLDGELEARFSIQADRLEPHGDGVVALRMLPSEVPGDAILAPDGSVLGTVAPSFTLPPVHATIYNPLGSLVPVTIIRAPSAFAGDGNRTTWYLVPNEPVLREYQAGP